MISMLQLASLVVALLSSIAATSAIEGLHLKSYSEAQVEGCYIHNETMGVCFDIGKGHIKLMKTTGEQILLYRELGPDMLFYQVLDQAFIGHEGSMAYVPNDVPETPEARRTFLRQQKGMAGYEALKNHYQQAMSELHYVPEVQLLERASAALADNSTRLEVLKPFHSLCFNLLKASDVETPPELKAASDLEEGTIDGERQKRGCVKPTRNNCRGLCGPGCWCWKWFCGDCCWHRGCYEHDLCCEKKPYSSYCFVPVGLSCSGFSYYQKCINITESSWW